MNSKERFLAAIERKKLPDRLPVSTHHVMPYFLEKYLEGITDQKFFDLFKLDPILWINSRKADTGSGDYFDPNQKELGYLESKRICSDNWRIEEKMIPDSRYRTIRYFIHTPEKTLSMLLQTNDHTSWVTEPLIKEPKEIELIGKYATIPLCDVDEVNMQVKDFGERGLVRGLMPFFDIYGQPGCWQDAAVMFGIQNLIIKTFEDPEWVHSFLEILLNNKSIYVKSMKGANFDILEHGGGDASSTVISPKIFDRFVAPYDAEIIRLAHEAGQKVVYHTCGGMMPILENIVAMKPDAIETFTPVEMGGDTDLKEAKKRIGDKVCLIGGFDQYHHFENCSPDETRRAVRRCFTEAGENGGFILCPSDHFFDADPELIKVYSDEAGKCRY